jgi:hypothetical protein
VTTLQKFLFEKGFLKANPNGYYGVGTFAAVKAYQKSAGITTNGVTGPATRAAIKSESCKPEDLNTKPTTVSSPVPSVVVNTTPVVVKPVVVTPKTPAEVRNDRRLADVTTLLRALYDRFVYNKNLTPMPVNNTPIELCVTPQSVLDANATTTVIIVPSYPCKDFVEITALSPYQIKDIPRDPSLASTSVQIGYMVTRNESNDVSVIVKTPENGIVIKATCNFNSSCTDIKRVEGISYDVPVVASTSRTVLIKGATLATPFAIYGRNFTATNTLIFTSRYGNVQYSIPNLVSTDGITITVPAGALNGTVSCGYSCSDKIPVGEYDVTVSSPGGISNTSTHISMKGYMTSTMLADTVNSVRPKVKNLKVASFTIGADIPITVKSLTLSATNTSSILLGKIKQSSIKDAETGNTLGGGKGDDIAVSQSKKYDLYLDIDEMAFSETGPAAYTGYFTITDSTTNASVPADMTVPIKDLLFGISY